MLGTQKQGKMFFFEREYIFYVYGVNNFDAEKIN